MITVSLSHLLERGTRPDTGEAIAITQLVIAAGVKPVAEGIHLTSNGGVLGTAGRGDVQAIATLLDFLLPAHGVPAPLRYAVARGLGSVAAPPFASPEAFSAAVARFETGAPESVVRGFLARARPQPAERPARVAPAPATPPPAPSPVMRPADDPVAEVPIAHEPIAAPVMANSTARPALPRQRRGRERAAAVAAALLVCALIGFVGGEALRRGSVRRDAGKAHTVAGAPASNAVSTAGHTASGPAPVRTVRTTGPRDATPPAAESSPGAKPAESAPEPSARMPFDPRPRRVLPRDEWPAYSPAFASDGTALFFQTGGPGDPSSAIAVAPANGSPTDDLRIMTVVDDGSRNYHAQPSPDGKLIAFDSDRDGERGVYVSNRDGTHVRRVSGPGYAALPTWSPDGTRLTYVRAEVDRPSVWNLWLQPLNGGSAKRLTWYRVGQTWNASWFPDDRRIAYSHEEALYVLDVESGAARAYRTPVAGRLVRTPAVSPDGSRIVFQVYRAGAWVLDLRDGSMQCVLADPTAEEFAWAPDGRRLAFHSRRDGHWGVYVLSRG